MPATDQALRPTPHFKATDLGDEYMFYDRDGERVHVLNSSAREIYLLCDGSRTMDEVARAFAERYPSAGDEALRDAQEMLLELLQLGLIADTIAGAPAKG